MGRGRQGTGFTQPLPPSSGNPLPCGGASLDVDRPLGLLCAFCEPLYCILAFCLLHACHAAAALRYFGRDDSLLKRHSSKSGPDDKQNLGRQQLPDGCLSSQPTSSPPVRGKETNKQRGRCESRRVRIRDLILTLALWEMTDCGPPNCGARPRMAHTHTQHQMHERRPKQRREGGDGNSRQDGEHFRHWLGIIQHMLGFSGLVGRREYLCTFPRSWSR